MMSKNAVSVVLRFRGLRRAGDDSPVLVCLYLDLKKRSLQFAVL